MVSKRFDKIVLSVFVFLVFAFSAFMLTNDVVRNANAATTSITELEDYSYEEMSLAGAQFFIECVSDRNWDILGATGYTNYASVKSESFVGGFLGYLDPSHKDTAGSVGVLAENATVYNSEFLQQFKSSSGFYPLLEYQGYGQLLNDLGIDETTFGGAAKNDSQRLIVSWLYRLAYLASIMLNVFFNLVFAILGYANPFKLFEGVEEKFPSNSANVSVSVTNGVVGDIVSEIDTGISDLRSFVGHFYPQLKSMSLTVILPLTLAVTLFMFFVWKRSFTGQQFVATFKNYLIKLTFVVLGLPLMFACYATTIDLMGDFTTAENAVATKVVMSTFCNFEEWAKSNLDAGPLVSSAVGNVELESHINTGSIGSSTANYVRHACLKINQYAFGYGFIPISSGSNTDFLDSTNYHKALLSPSNNSEIYELNSMSAVENCLGLLEMYGSGSVFSSADYVAYRNSHGAQDNIAGETLNNNMFDYSYKTGVSGGTPPDNSSFINHIKMCSISVNKSDFDPNHVSALDLSVGNVHITETQDNMRDLASNRFSDGGDAKYLSIWNDGCLSNINTRTVVTEDGETKVTGTYLTILHNGGGEDVGARSASGNLSTMSMYNYLRSKFSNGCIEVYSASESAADEDKISHYSVTCAGNGLMEIVFVIDGLVLMASIVVIGYCYGVSMLVSNFKAIFKIIPSVLTGMLGFMSSIATVVVLVAALILEIICTCLVYSIACDLMYAIYLITEVPINELFKSITVGSGSGTNTFIMVIGEASQLLLSVASIFIMIQIIKYALKFRYAIVRSATEAVTAKINSFFKTNVAAPALSAKSSTIGGKAATAAMSAAGLGMAASAMSKDGTLQGYKNSFAEALGIQSKSDSSSANGGSAVDDEVRDGTVTASNPFGVKTSYSSSESGSLQQSDGNTESNTEATDSVEGETNTVEGGNAESKPEVTTTNGTVIDGESEESDSEVIEDEEVDASEDAGLQGGSSNKIVVNKEETTNNNITAETDDSEDNETTTEVEDKASKLASGETATSATAEEYIEENQETFLASLDENNAVTSVNADTGEIVVTNSETGEQSVINPLTGEVSTVDPETGETTPVDNVRYDATTGQLIAVDPVTKNESVVGHVEVDSVTGEGVQVAADGEGSKTIIKNTDVVNAAESNMKVETTTQVQTKPKISKDDNTQFVMTMPDGSKVEGYTMINAKTGEKYTNADRASGASYSIVDSQGNAYVDASGRTYANVPSSTYLSAANGQNVIYNPVNGSMMVVSETTTNANTTNTTTVTTTGTNTVPSGGVVTSGSAPNVSSPTVAPVVIIGGGNVSVDAPAPAPAPASVGSNVVTEYTVVDGGNNGTVAVETVGGATTTTETVTTTGGTTTVYNNGVTITGGGSETIIQENIAQNTTTEENIVQGGGNNETVIVDATYNTYDNNGGGTVIENISNETIVDSTEYVAPSGDTSGEVITGDIYSTSTTGSGKPGQTVININKSNSEASTVSDTTTNIAAAPPAKPEEKKPEGEGDEESDENGEASGIIKGFVTQIAGAVNAETARKRMNSKDENK